MREPKRTYQLIAILKSSEVNEEVVKEIAQEIESESIELLETDSLGARQFAYPSNKMHSGYYVRYLFKSSRDLIQKLRIKLSLHPALHLQYYLAVSSYGNSE